MKRKHWFCSKNFIMASLYGYTYCDGPKGNGVERSCGKSCLNFCNAKPKLIEQFNYLFEKWDLSEQECQIVRDKSNIIKR